MNFTSHIQSSFNSLKNTGRLQLSILLASMALFCFSLSIFRCYATNTKVFLFLNWNLFLAIIPWILSTLFIVKPKFKESKFATITLLIVWLLFFPNSPYILTDLFHLRLKTSVPVWYDLFLILSFAWTGLAFGIVSLMDLEKHFTYFFSQRFSNILIVVLLFISSFGVYIGRYLRWNSWDIASSPIDLLSDIGSRFINPFDYPRTWSVTILLGLFLNMVYWFIQFVTKSRNPG